MPSCRDLVVRMFCLSFMLTMSDHAMVINYICFDALTDETILLSFRSLAIIHVDALRLNLEVVCCLGSVTNSWTL